MQPPSYAAAKALAYPVLATIASCDHSKAKCKGYADGWELLLDKHDENEMALFCASLPTVLSESQRVVLLDGLAQEYGKCADWGEFVDVCCEHPDWKPSKAARPACIR